MAKKKPSLLDGIASMKAVQARRPPSWYGQMRESDPEAFGEIMEVARDFQSGGVSFQKLKTQTALFRCLRAQNAVPKISQSAFDNFMKHVEDGDHGQAAS